MPPARKTNRKPKAATQPVFVGEHLIVEPRVCHGQLAFRGTRVLVETILSYPGRGYSMDYLHKSWPEVSPTAMKKRIALHRNNWSWHPRAQPRSPSSRQGHPRRLANR
jgi:uncharacterized protein (DUF433 family)